MSEPSSTEFRPDKLEFLTVLGLAPPVTEEDVKQAYLVKARTAHPDAGGDVAGFKRLQEAYEQATEYARFKASRMQWLSRWVEQYAEQEKVIERIKALGGEAEVKSSDPLTRSIGADFAVVLDKVTSITLRGKQIDDAVIDQLIADRRMLAGLRKLALLETTVSAAGLLKVRVFETIRRLDLTGTKVDQDALEVVLGSLPQIEQVELGDTGIGWASKVKLRLKYRNVTFS
ncbi:MAG: hypothetical protein DWQ37_01425 [Planctomycetota bacterium]|nr:MAG: hypothetical protein DWQ37_01425 [Planctomycetota bacterium]